MEKMKELKKKSIVLYQKGKIIYQGLKKPRRMVAQRQQLLQEKKLERAPKAKGEMSGRGRSQMESWCLFEGMYGLSMWTSVMMRIG